MGSTETPGGALRASLGHPEPFELKWVEVGNEVRLDVCSWRARPAERTLLGFYATQDFFAASR